MQWQNDKGVGSRRLCHRSRMNFGREGLSIMLFENHRFPILFFLQKLQHTNDHLAGQIHSQVIQELFGSFSSQNSSITTTFDQCEQTHHGFYRISFPYPERTATSFRASQAVRTRLQNIQPTRRAYGSICEIVPHRSVSASLTMILPAQPLSPDLEYAIQCL